MIFRLCVSHFFFFNDTATTEIYTLSLHDALPIFRLEGHIHRGLNDRGLIHNGLSPWDDSHDWSRTVGLDLYNSDRRAKDRKSTRLNSSHVKISYAVFCLKKKNKNIKPSIHTHNET